MVTKSATEEQYDRVTALAAWLHDQEINHEDGIKMMVDMILIGLFGNAADQNAVHDEEFYGYQMHRFIFNFLSRAQQFWESEQRKCR